MWLRMEKQSAPLGFIPTYICTINLSPQLLDVTDIDYMRSIQNGGVHGYTPETS